MKRIVLFSVAALLALPIESNAQGFLQGLKEKVANEVNNSKESVSSIFGGNSDKKSSKKSSSYSPVKPSKANSARELLNELPPIPTAAQIAEREDGFFNHFNDQIYAVQNRMRQLREANEVNMEEEDRRVREQMVLGLTGGKDQSQQMSQLQNFDPTKAQAVKADNEKRLAQLQKEMEAIEARYKRTGTLSEADQQRSAEIGLEMQQMMAAQMNALSEGGLDLGALISMSKESASNAASMFGESPSREAVYKTEYDKSYAAMRLKMKKLDSKNEREYKDSGVDKSKATINTINSTFRRIWAAQDEAAVKELYAKVDEMITNFYTYAAQSRIDEYGAMYNDVLSLLTEAEKFAADIPDNSMIPPYQIKNAPYDIVELWINLMGNLWGAADDADITGVKPFKKVAIDLQLMPGDVLLSEESSIYQMLGYENVTSVFGAPKSSDTIVEDFLSKAVFLVQNSQDGYYYMIENGKRTRLGNQYRIEYDFYQRYNHKDRREKYIQMKSLDKKIMFTNQNDLEIPFGKGHWYSPIAIQRTNDWLLFITMENDTFTKCMLRL